MSGPRNLKAFRRAQRERAEIRRVWLELVQQHPFERHDAREIARHLRFRLSLGAVRWHMRAIRTAAVIADVVGQSR